MVACRDAGSGASARAPEECSCPAPARAATGPSEVSTEQVTITSHCLAKTIENHTYIKWKRPCRNIRCQRHLCACYQ